MDIDVTCITDSRRRILNVETGLVRDGDVIDFGAFTDDPNRFLGSAEPARSKS